MFLDVRQAYAFLGGLIHLLCKTFRVFINFAYQKKKKSLCNGLCYLLINLKTFLYLPDFEREVVYVCL